MFVKDRSLAVPLPSQVVHHIKDAKTRTQLIRDEIRNIIIGDDRSATELFRYAFEPGKAGNRQMDQAVVAERLFNHVDEAGKLTMLASYDLLTHKELWHHFSAVMVGLGYVQSGGYFLRHGIADESKRLENAKEVNNAA